MQFSLIIIIKKNQLLGEFVSSIVVGFKRALRLIQVLSLSDITLVECVAFSGLVDMGCRRGDPAMCIIH